MDVVLGAAAITKFDSLPIAVVLFALALVSSLPGLGRISTRASLCLLFDVVLARAAFFGSMGYEVFNVRMRKKLGKG